MGGSKNLFSVMNVFLCDSRFMSQICSRCYEKLRNDTDTPTTKVSKVFKFPNILLLNYLANIKC